MNTQRLKKIVFFLFILVTVAVLFEITVRFLDLSGDGGLKRDKNCDFRLDLSKVPEARDIYPEIPLLPAGRDSHRILIVGDSFSHRLKSEGFLKCLFEDLQYASKKSLDVFSAACPAYGMAQYWKYLKTYGMRINPDWVVLNIFVENDIYESDPNRSYDIIFGILTPTYSSQSKWVSLGRKIRLLRICEVIYRAQKARINLTFFTSRSRRPKKVRCPILPADFMRFIQMEGAEEEWAFLNGMEIKTIPFMDDDLYFYLSLRDLDTFKVRLPDYYEKARLAAFEYVEKICRLARQKEWRLLVFLFPSRFQVDERLRREAFEKLNLNESLYDFDRINNELERLFSDNGASVYDMTEKLRIMGSSGALYGVRDIHWNHGGSLLAVKGMHAALKEKLE